MQTVFLPVRVDGVTFYIYVPSPITGDAVFLALDKKTNTTNGRWELHYKKWDSTIKITNEQMLQEFCDQRSRIGYPDLEAKRIEPPPPPPSTPAPPPPSPEPSSCSSSSSSSPTQTGSSLSEMGPHTETSEPSTPAPSYSFEEEVRSLRRDLTFTIKACEFEKQENTKMFQEMRAVIESQATLIHGLRETLNETNRKLERLQDQASTNEKLAQGLQFSFSSTKSTPENPMMDDRIKTLQRKMGDYTKRDEVDSMINEKIERATSDLINLINQRNTKSSSPPSSSSSSQIPDPLSCDDNEDPERLPNDNAKRERKMQILTDLEGKVINCISRIHSILEPNAKPNSVPKPNPNPDPDPRPQIVPPVPRFPPEGASALLAARFNHYKLFCDESQQENLWRIVAANPHASPDHFQRLFEAELSG